MYEMTIKLHKLSNEPSVQWGFKVMNSIVGLSLLRNIKSASFIMKRESRNRCLLSVTDPAGLMNATIL